MRVFIPHFIYQFRICHNESAFSAEWVRFALLFKFCNKLKVTFQEELGQFIGVAEALQTWVHEAGVAQIWKTNLSIICTTCLPLHLYHTDFICKPLCTCTQMEALVFSTTSLITISHTLAFANDLQCIPLRAEFAVSDMNPLLLFIFISELWTSNLDYNQLSCEFLVLEVQWCANVWLNRFSREFDSRIFFNIAFYIK